ncbi:MAG: hypothetical protein ABEH56_03915 [Salinirussus sp.]
MSVGRHEAFRRAVPVAVGIGALAGYSAAVGPTVRSLGQVIYPVVWTAGTVVAVVLARSRLDSLTGGTAAVGGLYTLFLCWSAGLIRLTGPGAGPPALSIHLGLPGWGPAVVYSGPGVSVTAIPFLLAGYLALGLLAAVVLAGAGLPGRGGGLVAGLAGLCSCVSCGAPAVAGVAAAAGLGSAHTVLAGANYPVATVAFLLAVAGFRVVLVLSDGRSEPSLPDPENP